MVQLKLEVVIPAEGQRSNAAVKDNVDNVLVHVRKGIRMGLKQPQQPVFRFLLPHLDQVHDHDPGIAVQARIRYPHAADVFQMVGKAARTDALQDGAVPDGAYRRAVQVRIVKFGHVSIQQHVHVQVNHPVVPGEQGGGQQASICEGGRTVRNPCAAECEAASPEACKTPARRGDSWKRLFPVPSSALPPIHDERYGVHNSAADRNARKGSVSPRPAG